MKKVIVTGANGFIGRYLLRELSNLDYEIFAVVRNKYSNIDSIKDLDVNLVYCDLNEIFKLEELIPKDNYDSFFHLAWTGSSGGGRKDYALQLNNARFCTDAAEVAYNLGCKRFIGAGSVTELMYRDYLNQDNTRPEMVTCYAVGKIAAKYTTKCICNKNGIDFLWGYISNFYGAEDTTQNFINFLIDNYTKGISPILTDGCQKADFMYVSDVARALVAMAEKGKTNNSYYIGYGEPQPLKNFVTKIRDIIDPSIETGLGRKEFHGLDIDFEKANYMKLTDETGFKPLVKFETGIEKTICWRKEFHGNI